MVLFEQEKAHAVGDRPRHTVGGLDHQHGCSGRISGLDRLFDQGLDAIGPSRAFGFDAAVDQHRRPLGDRAVQGDETVGVLEVLAFDRLPQTGQVGEAVQGRCSGRGGTTWCHKYSASW